MKNAATNQQKSYRWPLSFLLLATLALGAAWAYQQKDALTLRAANHLLRAYDVEVIRISSIHITMESASVGAIEIRIPQSSDIQTINHLQLQFDAFELLRGKFKSLTAQSATLSAPLQSNPNGIHARLSDINLRCSAAQICTGSAQLEVDVSAFELEDAGFQISASRVSSAVDLGYEPARLSLSLPPGLQLSLESASYGDLRLEQLELIASQALQLQLNLDDQTFLFGADATNLTFSTTGAADSQTSIRNINISCSALDNCDAHADVDVKINAFQLQDTGLLATGLGLISEIEMQYRASALKITIPSDFKLTLESGSFPGYRIEQIDAVSLEPWEFDIDLLKQHASVVARSTALKFPVIRTNADSEAPSLSGLTMNLQALNTLIDFSTNQNRSWHQQLSGSANLEISQVYTTLAPYNFWPYQWSTHLQWLNADQLLIDLDVTHSEQQLFSVGLNHSLSNQRGTANFKLEQLSFSPAGAHLSSYVSPLPVDADLLDGSIALQGNVGWHADPDSKMWQPEGQIQLQLQELAGFMDEIVFKGLDASSAWSLRPDWSVATLSAFTLSIREIDPGIPLFNVQSLVSVDTASGLIHLQAPGADVFGGTVSTGRIDVFLPHEDRIDELGETFELTINAIDVAQVLSLSAYEQVSATGIISGVLPVRFKGLTPVIEAGQLSASQQGGSIRYDQGGSASGNQNLDLVYQALEHYQYDTLSAGVDFDENGELTLSLQMQGQSPNLGQGQRINLNLNISDNIPALLQSLQAADNIAERLQDMLE